MKPVPPVTRMVFFIFRLWNRGGKHARRSFNLFYDFSSDHMPSASSGWLWCGEVTNYFVISILQKTTFFCALRSKTFPFRRNSPQKFFVRSSKRIKPPKCRGNASPTPHSYIASFGSWSSTFPTSAPRLQNIRSKGSMIHSSLWGDITKLRTKSKNKGDFLKKQRVFTQKQPCFTLNLLA